MDNNGIFSPGSKQITAIVTATSKSSFIAALSVISHADAISFATLDPHWEQTTRINIQKRCLNCVKLNTTIEWSGMHDIIQGATKEKGIVNEPIP